MTNKRFLWWCFDSDFSIEFSDVTENIKNDCLSAFIENGGYLVTQDSLKNPIGIKLEVF